MPNLSYFSSTYKEDEDEDEEIKLGKALELLHVNSTHILKPMHLKD